MDDMHGIFTDEDEDDMVVLAVVNAVKDEQRERQPRPRPPHTRVAVDLRGWRLMDGVDFMENFRMRRHTFQELVYDIGNHLHDKGRFIKTGPTPFNFCVLYAVWILANGSDSFRSTSSHFNKTKGVIHYHYAYIIEALREMAPKYIKWPDAAERQVIQHRFERRYGYPNVVGCVDGTHIEITAPLNQPQQYINRHHKYSVIVQATCDHNMLYRDIFVGQPGSVGDSRTYSRSPLSTNLYNEEFLSEDEHILGDGAYTLTRQVIVPYPGRGILSRRARLHNFLHSKSRSTVERSFCLLKGKWRRLKRFHVSSVQYCIDHITASLVLHNYILLDGEECLGLTVDRTAEEPSEEAQEAAQEAGALKRDAIAEWLCPNEL